GGRSEGAEWDFYIGAPGSHYEAWRILRQLEGFPAESESYAIRVYTTRPNTPFGASYIVLGPEHPLVDRLTTEAQRAEVESYRQRVASMSEEDRIAGRGEKSGVFTGGYAINPVNGERIPVWIADYVLISYGTGAIMAVPAHDQRDFEFAKKFGLKIRAVVDPGNIPREVFEVSPGEMKHPGDAAAAYHKYRQMLLAGEACMTQAGTAINSGKYNGSSTEEFKKRITNDLSEM